MNNMNAKEEVLEMLKYELRYGKIEKMDYYSDLITAVERAIFDVPSEEEISKKACDEIRQEYNLDLDDNLIIKYYHDKWNLFMKGFKETINFKKPETDGK